MARLVINPGTPSAWEAELKPGPNYIGRGFANDIKIPDASVSGSHCEITVDNSSVVIKDLGSTNGTFVNRAPVREASLKPGQTIHLGGVEMRLLAEAASAPSGISSPPPLAPPVTRVTPPGGSPLPSARVTVQPITATRAPAQAVIPPPPPPPSANPPVPPPIAPTAIKAGAGKCKYHPRTMGRFFCPTCQLYYCELCVNSHNVGGLTHKYCRQCSAECVPVQAPTLTPAANKTSFLAQTMSAFTYPLKGDGAILLLTGTFFFSILDAGRFFAHFAGLFGLVAILILFVLGTGYLTCYLRRIVTSSAMGETKMPDWPDVSDIGSDILDPFFQLLGMTLVCFLPTILVSIFVGMDHPDFAWLIIATIVLGCIYYPMAFLAVAMLDSVVAVNPLVVIPTIVRVPTGYLITVCLFGAAFAATSVGTALLDAVIPLRFISAIISRLIGLYLLIVQMRVLGLLYFCHKQRFAWLNR